MPLRIWAKYQNSETGRFGFQTGKQSTDSTAENMSNLGSKGAGARVTSKSANMVETRLGGLFFQIPPGKVSSPIFLSSCGRLITFIFFTI